MQNSQLKEELVRANIRFARTDVGLEGFFKAYDELLVINGKKSGVKDLIRDALIFYYSNEWRIVKSIDIASVAKPVDNQEEIAEEKPEIHNSVAALSNVNF